MESKDTSEISFTWSHWKSFLVYQDGSTYAHSDMSHNGIYLINKLKNENHMVISTMQRKLLKKYHIIL